MGVASKTRKSIIAACERVRRTTTHPGCSWNSDSLASAESRAILVQLPIPRHSQIVTKERTAMRDTPRQVAAYGKRRYSVTFQRDSDEMSSNRRTCNQWEKGLACRYGQSCRFLHKCNVCGDVETHNPFNCKLKAMKSART